MRHEGSTRDSVSREEIIDKRELQEQKRITTAMKRLLHELGTNGVDALVDYAL